MSFILSLHSFLRPSHLACLALKRPLKRFRSVYCLCEIIQSKFYLKLSGVEKKNQNFVIISILWHHLLDFLFLWSHVWSWLVFWSFRQIADRIKYKIIIQTFLHTKHKPSNCHIGLSDTWQELVEVVQNVLLCQHTLREVLIKCFLHLVNFLPVKLFPLRNSQWQSIRLVPFARFAC